MARDLFKEAGFTPEQIEALKNQNRRQPRDLFQEAGITPEQIKRFKESQSPINKLANNSLISAINSIGAGANMAERELGTGAYNLAARALGLPRMAAPKPLPNDNPNLEKISEFATNLAMPLPGINKLKAAAKGGSALIRALASLGDAAATGGAYGAVYGANDPNKSIAKSAGEGAALGGALHGLLGAVVNSAQGAGNLFLRKLNKESNQGHVLTPEQTKNVYEKVEPLLKQNQAKIDIGSLVGNPIASRKYNQNISSPWIRNIVENNQKKLVGALNKEASSIIKDLSDGKGREGALDKIKNTIQSMADSNRNLSQNKFENVLDAAEKDGVKFKLNAAKQYAKDILKREEGTIASPIESGELRRALENAAGLKSLIKPLINRTNDIKSTPNQVNNASTTNNTLKKAHFSHSNLGQLATKYASRGDNKAASIAYGLQKALEDDIQNALSGTPHYQSWKEAREFFKNNVAPFEDTTVKNILQGRGKDLRFLPNEILRDKNKAIYDNLDQNTKNLIALERFKSAINDDAADESTNVNRLISEYKKLKMAGKHRVLDEKMRKRIERLDALNKRLGEAKIAVKTPATGARNEKSTNEIMKALIALSSYGIKPYLPFLAYGGKALNDLLKAKGLTSDALRNAYIRGGFKYRDPSSATNALTRATLAQLNRGYKNAN